MAATLFSDFKILDPYYYSGVFEGLTQNINLMNGAGAGAIVMTARDVKGHFNKTAFFRRISGLVSRRDITSLAGATSLAVTQDEGISVKVDRKIGPLDITDDALVKAGVTIEEYSYQIGLMVGEEKAKEMLNSGIAAFVAAVARQATACYDGTGGSGVDTGKLTHQVLLNGLAKFGDAAGTIKAFVVHSKVAFDLLGNALTEKVVNVADMVIREGTVATLGRPLLVTDSPKLLIPAVAAVEGSEGPPVVEEVIGRPVRYRTLGLTAGAIDLLESESQRIVGQKVLGLENIVNRTQGEYAFNIGLKGYKWNMGDGGGISPTDAALATGSNWSLNVGDIKLTAGLVIETV